jgi:galactose mutarotase-like enzyme
LPVLENSDLKVIANAEGFCIDSVYDKRACRELMWSYDAALWPRRTSVCFPICGKLLDDTYSFKSKLYHLASHGLARQRTAEVLESKPLKLVLRDRWDEGTLKAYPFKYCLRVSYELDGPGLKVGYEVTNEGDELMLYSIGSHYSYALPLEQQQCFIHFSRPQNARFFDYLEGSMSKEGLDGQSCFSLSLLNDGSRILLQKDLDTDWVGLGTRDAVKVKVKPEGFAYLVTWALGGGRSPFACIEMWDGMADIPQNDGSLERKLGIRTLGPGETRHYMQTISACIQGDRYEQ